MRISDWSSDVCSSDLHGLLGAGALHAVVEHDVAERAGGGDAAGAGGDELLGPLVVDLLAEVFLHPHAGATGAAAHALGAVALGLDQLDALQAADHVPGRHVDVVVAAEVAGVVVDDTLVEAGAGHVELAALDEDLPQLAVVHALEVPAHLGVLREPRDRTGG